MAPLSRFALSLKPNVAYLVLNFCALWKKQTTDPSREPSSRASLEVGNWLPHRLAPPSPVCSRIARTSVSQSARSTP
jgi:hypothetical protein